MRQQGSENGGEALPAITFRQLQVFRLVCRERSFANAAVERRTTRASIKRLMRELEEVVGRSLFEERPGKDLELTAFGQGLLNQVVPLSRSLRRLGDGVKSLHEEGRILRFAAPGEFFRDGRFADFVGRLKVADLFRPCFMKIEVRRFRTALLNAECDVYFGVGLAESERLDSVDFGPVAWRVVEAGEVRELEAGEAVESLSGPWGLGMMGEPEAVEDLLEAFRRAGAKGGKLVEEAEWREAVALPKRVVKGTKWLVPEVAKTVEAGSGGGAGWPGYRFTAVMRRNHPYAELKPRLQSASGEGERAGHGH